MTNWFLKTFFQGDKQGQYRHFSFTILLACVFTLFMPVYIAGITAVLLMIAIEFHPNNTFSLTDILYDFYCGIDFLSFQFIKEFLLIYERNYF